MVIYDLLLLWNWEYDSEFVSLIENNCHSMGLKVLQVTPQNIGAVTEDLLENRINFRSILDRASEDDVRFVPLVKWAMANDIYFINPHHLARRSCNKAIMHYELIHNGIYTPYTVIVPPYESVPQMPEIDFSLLGNPFIVKPSLGSGGEGVVMGVTSLDEMTDIRHKHPQRTYLLQTDVKPRYLNDHPAWFRILFCRGAIHASWWHPDTHLYRPVHETEISRYEIAPLFRITRTIGDICGLDLFSTEIASVTNDRFIVIDYVNDQPDLRMCPPAGDGVPDFMVHDIAESLARLVSDHSNHPPDHVHAY